MDYVLNYESIEEKWRICAKEIDRAIREELHTPDVQRIGKTSTSHRSSPIANTGYKLLEITPKLFEKDQLIYKRDWYTNQASVQRVSDVIQQDVEKHGFSYIGVELEEDGSPIFVVKVGG